MLDAEEFIYTHEGNQKEVMLYLHNLLLSYPGVTCKISFKIPFYYRKSWICYLNPLKKKDSVELVFTRGKELSNSQGLLQSKGRKMVMGIEIEKVIDIPNESLVEIIQEALLLDESVPYNVKKSSKG